MKLSIMRPIAGIAQLVEHNLAKVGVGSSSLLSRSRFKKPSSKDEGFFISHTYLITTILQIIRQTLQHKLNVIL